MELKVILKRKENKKRAGVGRGRYEPRIENIVGSEGWVDVNQELVLLNGH